MNDKAYYNYMNMNQFVKEMLLTGVNLLWIRYFKEICGGKMALFDYKNLPDKLTTRIIEEALMFNNQLCLYKSNGLNEVVLARFVPTSGYDIYYLPNKVNVISLSGVPLATRIPYSDIVPVRDNMLDIIPFLPIRDYIDRLMTIERTLDINVELLRLPTLFTGDTKSITSLQTLFRKIKNFEPYAIVDKSIANSIQVSKLDLNYDPTQIYELLERYRQLTLGSIGIYGADKKRERLITAEIESTNDFVDIIYDEMYRERTTWVDLANKKWGLNIELIERYVVNKEDEAEIKAKEAELIAEAEAAGGGSNE